MVSLFSTGRRLVCWLSVIEHRSIRWFRSMYFERVLCVSEEVKTIVVDRDLRGSPCKFPKYPQLIEDKARTTTREYIVYKSG